MNDFNLFLPIAKVEKNRDGSVTVHGYASTPSLDLDGEIVSIDAVKKALPGYWEWRNIREMHQPSAVGVAKEANVDDVGLFLTSRITDPTAAQKCLDAVYKGYSIGGKKLAKNGNTITELELIEVSLVDRPANPDCRIEIAKRAKDGKEAYLVRTRAARDPKSKALAKMAQAVELISKAGPPAAADGFSLPAKKEPQKPSTTPPNDARPGENVTRKNDTEGDTDEPCEEHGVKGCKECLGKREFSEEQRQAAASRGEAMPGGGFPIKNKKDLDNARRAIGRAKNPAATRAHIRSRAQALGVKLPNKWKKKQARKLIKEAEAEDRATKVALATLPPPAQSPFLVLKRAGRAKDPLELEASSPRLRKGGKARNDVDGLLLETWNKFSLKPDTAIYKGDLNMNGKAASLGNGEATSALDAAILNVIKRGMVPSRAKRMSIAQGNLKKARQARREAAEEVKNCHAALSKRYMAKMGKTAKDKKDDDDDEMAETEKVLKGLQKAYSALTTVKTFIKAADSQIAKAARSGQRGQEAGDSEPGFYEVPPGVKDMTPSAMAGAAPGTSDGGSQPPMYPSESVYPGKSALAKFADKNGMVPAAVAELAAEKAVLEGQVATLSRVSGSQKPFAFNMAKAYGIDPGQQRNKSAVLFEGVDPMDLNSPDEAARQKAAAKVAGNYLLAPQLGKSILDPSFRGQAGGRGQ